MEYFIDRGADVETGRPLAHALSTRIRTALRVLKRYRDRFASFPEQANVALRHHCIEGNMKWISLMLWAGADPNAPGPSHCDEELDANYGSYSALAFAALHRHYDVFALKQVRLDTKHPSMRVVAEWACNGEGLDLLKRLLEDGLEVNDQPNGGSSLLQYALTKFDWEARFSRSPWESERGIDTHKTRELMEIVHLLAEHGARWEPTERYQLNAVRRSLLGVKPEYTVEFVGIMTHRQLCTRDSLEALLRPNSMKVHVERYSERIQKLMAQLPTAVRG
jgi:hypothetical protein